VACVNEIQFYGRAGPLPWVGNTALLLKRKVVRLVPAGLFAMAVWISARSAKVREWRKKNEDVTVIEAVTNA
jgi:hypothetical protein